MTADVDAVVFDLDGTLCRYRRSPDELLTAACEAVGVEPCFSAEEYVEAFGRIAADHDTMADRRAAAFAYLATEAGRDPDRWRTVAGAYAEMRDHGDVVPLPGAHDALASLGQRYSLGLITNGPPESQQPKIATLGVAEEFETTVFAGVETALKPDREPFERACSDLGVAAECAVYVGNSLEHDVAGARAAGMRSVLVTGDGGAPPGDDDPTPDHRVRTPGELQSPPW